MQNKTETLRKFITDNRDFLNLNGITIKLGLPEKYLSNLFLHGYKGTLSEVKENEVFDFFRKLGYDAVENPQLKQATEAEIASLLQQKEDLQQEVQIILSKIKEIKNELENFI